MMSKYFKSNKSDGDEEMAYDKFRTKQRSYSCKPDIGPSGDHKTVDIYPCDRRRNFKQNMWMDNIGSGSSKSSRSNTDLHNLDENHLEGMNLISEGLEMMELGGSEESEDVVRPYNDLDEIENTKKISSDSLDFSQKKGSSLGSRQGINSQTSPKNQEISKNSNLKEVSSDSTIKYTPPVKKIRLLTDISINATVFSVGDGDAQNEETEIPHLNLKSNRITNENKSIQCSSRDTETTESTRRSTEDSNFKPLWNIGDNNDLVEEYLYIEPEIVFGRPQKIIKTFNKNCIKFLPMNDEETTCSENKEINETNDDIVSNCSFSLEHFRKEHVPSHESFFSKKQKRRKKLKKKAISKVKSVQLEKSSIEVRRMFQSESEISNGLEGIETDQKQAHNEAFDYTVMTGLALPSKNTKRIKLPLITKLSELINGAEYKRRRVVESGGCNSEDEISTAENNVEQLETFARFGTKCKNFKKAADYISSHSRATTDDDKDNDLEFRTIRNTNANEQRQSVDYTFCVEDSPSSRISVDKDEDSGCLGTIENLCCVRIWRRGTNFFSN